MDCVQRARHVSSGEKSRESEWVARFLDDRPPALLLSEGDLPDVGPKVLAAARQFAAVG